MAKLVLQPGRAENRCMQSRDPKWVVPGRNDVPGSEVAHERDRRRGVVEKPKKDSKLVDEVKRCRSRSRKSQKTPNKPQMEPGARAMKAHCVKSMAKNHNSIHGKSNKLTMKKPKHL